MGRPLGSKNVNQIYKPRSLFCLNGHEIAIFGRNITRGRFGSCKGCSLNLNYKNRGIINPDGSQFTIEDYNKAFIKQDGKCKICGKSQLNLERKLQADHDHITGIFRSLLCIFCNTDVGRYENRKIEIEKYLKDY
jgi:hypothetical protein